MIAGISIVVIFIVVIFIIVAFWCAVHNTTEYDDKIDDEEQIKYLQEWNMKHRKR